jgi:hypothetical protein
MDANKGGRLQLWGRSPLLTEPSSIDGGGARLHRYVVRFRGRAPAPATDVARIAGAVRVLDQAARMLLVEGSSLQMASLAEELPRWLVTEEDAFALGRQMDGSLGSDQRPEDVGEPPTLDVRA